MGRNYKKSTWGKTWDIFCRIKRGKKQKKQKKKEIITKKKKKKKNRSFYDNVIINASSVNNHVQPNEFV